MTKRLIELDDNATLATVVRLDNGIEVGRSKLFVRDLLISLFSMVEPGEMAQFILKDYESLEEALKPIISEEGPEAVDSVFRLYLDMLDYRNDPTLATKLLQSLAEHFDLAETDEETVNKLFRAMIGNIRKLKQSDAFNELFIAMMKKLELSSARDQFVTQVLRGVIDRAKSEEDIQILHDLFQVTAKKARRKWVMDVLSPYLEKQRIVRSPILPKDCIMYQEQIDGTKIVVIEVERARHDVFFGDTEYKDVGHPKLLFEFHVMGDRISRAFIHAVKDTITKPTSKLYKYPFGNVFESGAACWPQIGKMKLQNLAQLTTLPHLFFRSPITGHGSTAVNLREEVAKLEGNDFDDNILEFEGYTVEERFELNGPDIDDSDDDADVVAHEDPDEDDFDDEDEFEDDDFEDEE